MTESIIGLALLIVAALIVTLGIPGLMIGIVVIAFLLFVVVALLTFVRGLLAKVVR